MDPFSNDTSDTEEQDHDPAADFIAQEQNALAGIDDDYVDVGYPNGENQNGMATNVDYTAGLGFDEDANDYFPPANQNGINSTSVFEVPKIRPATPEKIRKWREDQKDLLERKDAEEDKKKQELRSQAMRELDEWYQLQDDSNKKAKKNNRDVEREFVQQRDSDKPGEEWERVARMCDFNPKNAKGTKDVSRLRSIILQLKQTPAS